MDALEAEGITIEAAHTGQGSNLNNMYSFKNDDEKTSILVKKVWDDSSNFDDIRPSSVTIKLKADNEVIKTQAVTGDGNTWEYTFTDLPTYKTLNDTTRQKIVYSIEEVPVAGYEAPVMTGNATSGYIITNTHKVPTAASKVFNGTKTLTENGQIKSFTSGQFKFMVTADENNPTEILGLPKNEISVGPDGRFSLGTLTFAKAGTYTFTVSELNGGAAGYNYDDKAVTVNVPVTLNEKTNTLEIGTVSYQKDGKAVNGISFANTYTTPTGANQVFNGTKTLTENGQTKAMTAGQFKFSVTADKSNPAAITGLPTSEISVGADGRFSLGTLSFTKVGTYTFTVSEVNGKVEGYSYDDKAVTVKVPVTLNEKTNTLEIGTVSYQKNGEAVDGISFTNTYKAQKISTSVVSNPKTRDTFSLILCAMLLIFSSIGLVAFGLFRKRDM